MGKVDISEKDLLTVGGIVLDHLREKKDYYSALKDMEQGITKDATVALPIDQKANDNIEDKIISFFEDHPEPDDAEVHAFAISMKLSPEELEEEIYKLLTSQLEKMDMNSFASENTTKDGIAAEANKKNLQILNRIVKKMSLNRIPEEKPKDEVKEYEQEQKKNMKSATTYKKGLEGFGEFVNKEITKIPDYVIPQIVSKKGVNNLKKLDSFVKKSKKGGKK